MQEYYIVFDHVAGTEAYRGSSPAGVLATMSLEPNLCAFLVPPSMIINGTFDAPTLKTWLTNQVNDQAGVVRRKYITDIAGQQATYLAKEAEAKAWTEGADEANFPYLRDEAAACSTTIDAVAALILSTAATWRTLDPKIEGARRGATVGIDAATTINAMLAAAYVDWSAVTA